jgi:hypothetical protein
MRRELRSPVGFSAASYKQAADFCMTNKMAPADALAWAQFAVGGTFIGVENFNNLMTLSRAQAFNGQEDEAKKTFDKAIAHPTAGPIDIHQAGRQLLTDGKKEEAMKIFQLNAEKFPNQWPVHVGLMRGYAALGDATKALAEAKLAMAQVPDPQNKASLEGMLKKLEAGKTDIN